MHAYIYVHKKKKCKAQGDGKTWWPRSSCLIYFTENKIFIGINISRKIITQKFCKHDKNFFSCYKVLLESQKKSKIFCNIAISILSKQTSNADGKTCRETFFDEGSEQYTKKSMKLCKQPDFRASLPCRPNIDNFVNFEDK